MTSSTPSSTRSASPPPPPPPVVITTYGPVRGQRRISYLNQPFYSFRSVPYAQPPLGELRFRDPQPPAPWTVPLDATVDCAWAPQAPEDCAAIAPTTVAAVPPHRTSEDCLVLNVFTPQLPNASDPSSSPALPVMVWLHGGSFQVGSASEHMHGPDFLLGAAAAQPVVLVTVNYRLGALGFLSLADPATRVPGNAGLKDQTLALRWVRQNIAAFGGSPHCVTLFGNSAGAGAVHLHMLSAHSAGLFDRAIVQSGSALSDWANYPKRRWAQRLAAQLGWDGDGGDAAVLAVLCSAPADALVTAQEAILTADERMAGMFAFGPASETYVAEQCFFADDPVRLAAARPWSARVPLMIGATADEGLLLYRAVRENAAFFGSERAFELLVPERFGYAVGSERSLRVAQQIRRRYYDRAEPSAANSWRTLQMWGDRAFWHGLHRSVVARSWTGDGGATFVYRYAGESGRFNWKKLQFVGEDVPGASHADEVHFLFKCAYLSEQLPPDCREMRTVRQMVGMWTQFAATGDPNCAEMGDVRWLPVDHGAGGPIKCLNIGATLDFIDLPETERIAFWEQLYAEHQPPTP